MTTSTNPYAFKTIYELNILRDKYQAEVSEKRRFARINAEDLNYARNQLSLIQAARFFVVAEKPVIDTIALQAAKELRAQYSAELYAMSDDTDQSVWDTVCEKLAVQRRIVWDLAHPA